MAVFSRYRSIWDIIDGMSTDKKDISKVRRNIDDAFQVAEEDRRKKLISQRIDIARSGIATYQKGDIVEAIRLFHTYIRVLEEIKNVAEGGLMPSCFDLKK